MNFNFYNLHQVAINDRNNCLWYLKYHIANKCISDFLFSLIPWFAIWSDEDLWHARRACFFMSVHGLDDLSVNCSEFWLLVRTRQMPFVNNMPCHPRTHLGTGCPVSRVMPDFLKFIYTYLLWHQEIWTPMGHSHWKFGHIWTSVFKYQRLHLNIMLCSKKVFMKESSPLHKKRYRITVLHLGKQSKSQWETKTQHHLKWKIWGPF